MKKLSIILFAVLITAGCSEVRFDKIPGVYQDLIPMEIQGKYTYYSKDIKSRLLDTLLVEINQNQIIIDGTYGETKLMIHQDFNLHKLGEIYVIGRQDKVLKSMYNLSVIEPSNKGLNYYLVNNKSIKGSVENKFDTYFPFLDVPYTYEAVPSEPIILAGEDGVSGNVGAPNMLRYYSISDEQFFHYFDKELKNKEFIPLKKETKEKTKKSK
jgi:hypothetical protein